jgi:ATP-dependent DNA helicase RecG
LSFIKTNIIREHVKKVPNQAEALRFYNFPYEAIEEALSNSVYHKGYDLGKPIEVQIWPDKLNILSYPGPIPPVDSQILQNKKIEARDYRNRRIGDFLKELDLTEGRGSGFPKIYKEMKKNGSPEPVIYTDEQRILFLTTLPVHPLLLEQESNGVNDLLFNNLEELLNFSIGVSNGVSIGVGNTAQNIIDSEIHDRVIEILELLLEPIKRIELFDKMALSNQSKNRAKYLDPLIKIGWITKEFSDENNPYQRYFTTESGKRILDLIRSIF